MFPCPDLHLTQKPQRSVPHCWLQLLVPFSFPYYFVFSGRFRLHRAEDQLAFLWEAAVFNSQNCCDNTCPSRLASYTSGRTMLQIAEPSIIPFAFIKPIHTALKLVSRRQFFIFGKLSLKGPACADRGYSHPWLRRLHSKQLKRFEMFTSLRLVLFHASKLKNVLNCRNLV